MTAATFTAPFRPPRLRVLLRFTACILGSWMLVVLFATSEFYRRSTVLGGAPPWQEVLGFQTCAALIWAVLTPLVLFLAERLPLRPPHRIRHGLSVIALIVELALFRAAFGGMVLNWGEGDPIALSMIKLSIGIRTHRDIVFLAVIFFIYNFVEAQREGARRERHHVRAQALLARTETDELRMRLQPRFALRMLRHIGSVVRDEPQAADALIVTLSALLRRSMARDDDEWIRLGDELEHLDHCLDLCRAGGRFQLAARYLAGDDVLACRVPALVLQPVIETVVLDLTSGAGGSVEVRCTREGNQACIEVSSTAASGGDFHAHEQSAAAVRARLASLYGGAASIQVDQRGSAVNTILRLPYQDVATPEIPLEATA
ncbi:MAG: hypothetical protein QOH21_1361 [Acidobacteriota bacterium]|jgi:hypothetical protein|nr:hypothetical protein [Acidobacteriota bacterium]